MEIVEVMCRELGEAHDLLDKFYDPRTRERDRKRLIKKMFKKVFEAAE